MKQSAGLGMSCTTQGVNEGGGRGGDRRSRGWVLIRVSVASVICVKRLMC